MLTEKRLNEALKRAKIFDFDKNDKYIFFSDVHRGDNSMSDEFARNQSIYLHAMNYYYCNGYRYVEIGDGEELWEHAKFMHIRRAHSDVYELLRRFFLDNRLTLIYGNHNIFMKNPHYVKNNLYYYYDEYLEKNNDLFPGIKVYESIILKYKETGQEVFVVHGHQGDLINDQLWRVSMLMLRYFWRYMHIIGFRNPASPAKNVFKVHKIEKNFNKWNISKKILMICGHTHRPKFPGKEDLPYINTGCCVHPRGITGVEIVNGQVMMVNWRVKPNEEGMLYINRKVIRGPLPIDYFNNFTHDEIKNKYLSQGINFE